MVPVLRRAVRRGRPAGGGWSARWSAGGLADRWKGRSVAALRPRGASMPWTGGERKRSGSTRQLLQQHLADPVAPPAAHHEHDVARPRLTGQPRPRRLDRSRGCDEDARPPRRHRARPAPRRTRSSCPDRGPPRCRRSPTASASASTSAKAAAAPRSGGTSAARRPPRRAVPARAGGPRRASPGSPSGGGRSRRRP